MIDDELTALAKVTAAIGRDPLLTQGAGGNTSVKCGDILWVKASGAWMRDAETRRIFVSTSISALRDAVCAGDAARVEAITKSSASPDGLRPSIEASLHAVIPHKAVIHAHPINSVLCSVIDDGVRIFSEAMAALGLRHRHFPYVMPGPDLASAIAQSNERAGAVDVMLLQNHGLIVGGDDPGRAEKLLRQVEGALAFPAREFDEDFIAETPEEDFEVSPLHGAVVRDPYLCEAFTRGALTPDQVVFLGGAPAHVGENERLGDAAKRVGAATGLTPMLLYRKGQAAFQRVGMSEGQCAMAAALSEMARRAPSGGKLTYLSRDQAMALVDWEAEHYRRAQDALRALR